MSDMRAIMLEASLPYLVMTLTAVVLSFSISLLQSIIADGANPTVIISYELVVVSLLLSSLAFFVDRGKRPPFSINILAWAFFLALLQVPLGELILVVSLRYITATFQTVALNTVPAVVFVLAVLAGREGFGFRSLSGQAKLWGIVVSTVGATVLVFVSDPVASDPDAPGSREKWVGWLLVGAAVLVSAAATLLLEMLALKYPVDLTLSATMTVFGTLQTLFIAALTERNSSSWKLMWTNNKQLFTILYGGIVTVGLGCFARNWCVRVKGPVFTTAFSPLLIVFSFLFQALVFGASTNLWSIPSALMVIAGLYLLLWAKSKESAKDRQKLSSQSSKAEPLLVNTA